MVVGRDKRGNLSNGLQNDDVTARDRDVPSLHAHLTRPSHRAAFRR